MVGPNDHKLTKEIAGTAKASSEKDRGAAETFTIPISYTVLIHNVMDGERVEIVELLSIPLLEFESWMFMVISLLPSVVGISPAQH